MDPTSPATDGVVSEFDSGALRRNAPLTYRDAGVDIEAGDRLVERIKPLAQATRRAGVLAGVGGFGALFEMPANYKKPVLVSGTDGVGTKLKLAFAWNRHDTVGIDLVAMSVNDILVQGAEPLFFLDYFACGRLEVEVAEQVISGIAEGCRQAQCALIGGETAEMPGMYPPGEYDLAGFAVGVVERDAILTGASIAAGDVVLGLASSGPHANGYSLIRRLLDEAQAGPELEVAGKPLHEWLLAPTRIYVQSVRAILATHPVKGLAHITGGGLLENLPRILPSGLSARIDPQLCPLPPIFQWLQRQGSIEQPEMFRTFNCGIGMAVVVPAAQAEQIRRAFESHGESARIIGEIVPSEGRAGAYLT